MFRTKSVDKVVDQFNKLVNQLDEVANHHADQAGDKEVRKIMLEQEINEHNQHSEKALTIASRIRNLIAA